MGCDHIVEIRAIGVGATEQSLIDIGDKETRGSMGVGVAAGETLLGDSGLVVLQLEE